MQITRIGDFEVHRIAEYEGPFIAPETFFPDFDKEVLRSDPDHPGPRLIDPATGNLLFSFHSFIVKTGHHTILIDSCLGNDKERPTRPQFHRLRTSYVADLARAGVRIEDIDYVMCTHLHADHVGWNTRLQNGRWVPTFPNARYLFSQNEYSYWAEEHAKNRIDAIADSVLPIVEAKKADLVSSEHALDDHVRLMPTPGHTPDHFAVCLGRGCDLAVLTGDLIHSPLQARYPELVMRVDYDPAQATATR